MKRCKECAVGLLGACSLDYCQSEREPLVENARQAAEARGHKLTEFTKIEQYPIWQAACSRCGKLAVVNLNPKQGERDISGEATTSVCEQAVEDVTPETVEEADSDGEQDAWYVKLSK